jgi:hypothetical protein
MTAQELWWEERNEKRFCKKDGVQLLVGYKSTVRTSGWMDQPPLECPMCHKQLSDYQVEKVATTRL